MEISNQLITIILGFVAVFAFSIILRRRSQAETRKYISGSEFLDQGHVVEEARKRADRILVDMAEVGREISAQMDTKIRVLNTLIRDADRCISRLEELQRQGKQSSAFAQAEISAPQSAQVQQGYQAAPASPHPIPKSSQLSHAAPSTQISQAEQLQQAATAVADRLRSSSRRFSPAPQAEASRPQPRMTEAEAAGHSLPPEVGQAAPAMEAPPPASIQPQGAVAEADPSSRNQGSWQSELEEKVLDLDRQGYTVPEMSQLLHLPRKEISLVLGLAKQKRKG